MRKRYRTKRGSCPLCHPEKTGHEPRWCPKELDALRQWELERLEWRGLRVPAAALEITAESRSPETYREMYGEGAAHA